VPILLVIAVILLPGVAQAHAVERGLILLLPTENYLIGGALAVGISFLILAVFKGHLKGLYRSLHIPGPGDPSAVTQWIGFFAFWGLVAAGFLGARDPLVNPLPLVVWTVWWIGFTALVAIIGDLWTPFNPWSAPVRLVHRFLGRPSEPPDWISHWPAILGFFAVVWFEVVDIAPEDPTRLARAVVVYWLIHFIAMCAWGDTWRQRAEAFSLYFSLIGRIAPIWFSKGVHLGWPGARLARAAVLPTSGWLFVIMTISAVTFDGLAGTFWWLAQIGVNPLEFPGRSAVDAENTFGLIGVWVAMVAAYFLTIWSGWMFAGRQANLAETLSRIALSLLPIALAYHLSHYLTVLLVNGQYALLALSDPLGTGADWLGLGAYPVTTSFLNNLADVELIWQVQTGLIVGGHLLAVLIAHAIALDLYPDRRSATLSQIPLAILMVAYTALGLWLLSTPTAV